MIMGYKGARMWQTKADLSIHNNYDIKLKVLQVPLRWLNEILYGHLLAFLLIRKHFHENWNSIPQWIITNSN